MIFLIIIWFFNNAITIDASYAAYHTIDTFRHPAYQYIAIGETKNSIAITQKIKNPVLEREYVRFYMFNV